MDVIVCPGKEWHAEIEGSSVVRRHGMATADLAVLTVPPWGCWQCREHLSEAIRRYVEAGDAHPFLIAQISAMSSLGLDTLKDRSSEMRERRLEALRAASHEWLLENYSELHSEHTPGTWVG